MPSIQHFCIAASSITAMTPECPKKETLYLPSSLLPSLCHSMCSYNLLEKELRLRIGQADDALNAVCKQLHIASMIIKFKKGLHYASQNLTHKMQMMMGNQCVQSHFQ